MNKVEKKFDLNDFISKSKAEKGSYILEKSKKILVPKKIHHNLKEAYKRKEFINTFIKDYINLDQNTEKEIKENIQNKIKLFKDDYINIKLPKLMSSKKIVYFYYVMLISLDLLKQFQDLYQLLWGCYGK